MVLCDSDGRFCLLGDLKGLREVYCIECICVSLLATIGNLCLQGLYLGL